MLDPSDEGSETEDVSNKSPEQFKKTCADCGTSKTPLWRGGPAGPKSMCNACGIRSRKKRRDASGLIKEKKPKKGQNSNNNSSSSNSSNKMGDGLKQRLMALGRDVMMRKRSSSLDVQKQRKKLGEEEQPISWIKIQKVIDARTKVKNSYRNRRQFGSSIIYSAIIFIRFTATGR